MVILRVGIVLKLLGCVLLTACPGPECELDADCGLDAICVDEHCELVSVDPEPSDGGEPDAGPDGGSNGITILTFSAPAVVEAGEMTTLTWTTSN
ncbi:MAG: hypothetical protein GY822_04375, partial [Deltaproteobacteria bacterium]|nr:hypothetical protein [Deltaproteobacteria bacterium]